MVEHIASDKITYEIRARVEKGFSFGCPTPDKWVFDNLKDASDKLYTLKKGVDK